MDLKIIFFLSSPWFGRCEKRFFTTTKDDSDINKMPKKIMMRFYMFSNSLKSDFNFYFSKRIDRKLLFNGMLELSI